MKFLKLLLNAIMTFAAAVANSDSKYCTIASPYENLPLNEVAPTLYNIELNIKYPSILGKSNIVLEVYHTIRHISLHACDLKVDIDSITLATLDMRMKTKNIIYKPQYVYCQTAQIMELTFKDDISPGIYNLYIKFELPVIDNKSLDLYDEKFWLSTIRAELNSARRVFPCWDNPGAKARFSISVQHSSNYTVLSNMPISYTLNEENDMKEIYFTKTPKITPREVAIAMIKSISHETSHISSGVTIWYRPEVSEHLRYMFFAIEDCKKTFNAYIGEYNMISKTDYILMPNISMKVMGYPGLIICREQDFTYYTDSYYPGRESSILNLLGQEMARQWFGGIISPSSWSDLLFSEMFALFLSHILTEKVQDKSIQDLYAVQMLQSAFRQDFVYNMKPILHTINNADKIEKDLYFCMYRNKGAALIRMLYYLFTANDFRNAMRMYFANNNYASFNLDDVWAVLQRVLDEGYKGWVYEVQEVMETWLILSSSAEVYVHRDHNSDIAVISKDFKFAAKIPITYLTQSKLSSSYVWDDIWHGGFWNETISGIPKDDFIIVNVQQVGYYRVNYDLESWDKIVSYLLSDDYMHIHVINRAQLIDDAFHFVMQGELELIIFVKLIWYLTRETNYIAWYPMFNILSYMSTYLELPEGEYFREIVQDPLASLLEEIGYEERPNENDMTKTLRLLAVRWACKLNIKQCKDAALSKLITYLDQTDERILPWWKEWIFCTGMETANLYIWQMWMEKCNSERNATCLTYLSCTRDEKVLKYYFNMLLEKQMRGIMNEIGSLTLFHTLFRKQAKHSFVLAKFVYMQNEIIEKIYNGHYVDPLQLLKEVIGTIYFEDDLYMMATYGKRLTFKNLTHESQFNKLIDFRDYELRQIAKKFSMFFKE